jgi:hypothetical protein
MKFVVNKISKINIFLPIILISFYYTVYKFEAQSAVDGGLILSNLINYPENFSNLTGAIQDSYTFLHQFALFFLKLNFSVDFISAIFVFIKIFFYTLGIYLTCLGISNSKNFSLYTSLIFILLRLNFGNVDYSVRYFSEHTYGHFALATFGMIIGLISNKNYKLLGLFSVLLLASHIVVGLWSLSILILSIIIANKFTEDYSYKLIVKGIIIGLPFLIISLIFFYLKMNGPENYDINDFNIYLSKWDFHRNIKTIHYDYIFKTLFLITIYTYFYFNVLNKKNTILFLFIVFSCLGSLLLYLVYKFFPYIFPSFIIRGMPSRLLLLHSVIGYPIIVSIIFYYINNKTNLFKIIYPNINKFYFLHL